MSQRQKPPGAAPEQHTANLRGNSAAKSAAAHANEVLASTKLPTTAERMESYLRRSITLPDITQGNGGHICWDNMCPSARAYMFNAIRHELIDEEKMCWSRNTQYAGQLICICFIPSCRIGPFVPFKT